ncbi:MAG: rRNA maturation RNase YbeY [Corallococcus sp.]|nr:rRNA maturation RNase YbeY [Corallococcus sp.]MCM1359834.1 rRNA maturation RNase YbeY [Corallococcus sp.]MCM1395268.1 rRNA maturation RNase YbeY [Corallococcus sp.]
MKIYFSDFKLYKHSVKKVLERALYSLGQPTDALEMSVSVVSAEDIRRLNAEFRKVDSVTDVLSFPTVDVGKQKINLSSFALDSIDPQTHRLNLGDVIICLDRAREQAEEYGHGLKRELCFLSLHGLLHLLGYDHETPLDEEEMVTLQKTILMDAGVTRK